MHSAAFISAIPLPKRHAFPQCRRRACCTLTEPPRKPVEPAAKTPPLIEKETQTAYVEGSSPPVPSLLEVLGERVVDTLEDIALHHRRLYGKLRDITPKKIDKPHIVVLGTGWCAHSFIKVIDEEAYDVTVVSPRNFYFFTPLLAATAVGTIELRSVVDPIRRANPFINFYEAACTSVDLERSEIECIPVRRDRGPVKYAHSTPFRLRYDYLLVSVGEKVGTFGVPGVREHAHFLKEIRDSIRLRRAIVQAFETAALPYMSDAARRDALHFVVVGGGPTGCEFAGELSDFLLRDLRAKYAALLPLVRVTLVQSGDSILTSFEKRLQARALENFANRRIEVLVNARVVEVTADTITLRDGRVIRHGVLIWAAGNSPRDITKSLIEAVNARASSDGGEHSEGLSDSSVPAGNMAPQQFPRKLSVDPWLRVQGTENVFALGDCSYLPEEPLPATAQVAGQQGAYLARAFRRWSKHNGADVKWDEAVGPFRFLSLGAMTYIGNEKALMQVKTGSDSPNIAFSGFVTYLLWASTYAVKQVATRNRILVLFDWFKTKVFGRDVSQF